MSNFNSPKEIAENVLAVGKAKTTLNFWTVFVLAILAGVYIAFGAQLATMVTHDAARYFGVGFAKFLGGSVFSVGLMLVVIGGAELFTGNNLIMTGVVKGVVSLKDMIKNWIIVYAGNFVGSLLIVILMFWTGLWAVNTFRVGASALSIANAKVNLTFMQAFSRAILCNMLVCLAVWMALAGKDIVSKIFAIYFPIMAFVAAGFEHSIANMYFIPMGIMLKTQSAVVTVAGLTDKISNLTWMGLVNNLIPVTLGNIVGGALFVGAVYAFAYLREAK
jgi:formate/nitrite transporter